MKDIQDRAEKKEMHNKLISIIQDMKSDKLHAVV